MQERAQWVCELAGLAAGTAGVVMVGAGLWGLLGAGLALLAASVPLVLIGNAKGGER